MEAASSAIWKATKCFCGFLNNKAAYVYNLEENLELLQSKWEKLEAMKKDVEANIEQQETTRGMQRSHQVKHWLGKIDTIQQEIKDIQVRGTKQIQNKCLSECCPKNCKSNYKLGKEVAKILRNVDELETEGEGFCKDSKIALKSLHKPNEMPCGETVGLDSMFKKVGRSIKERNVGIIGLYGMGGVGKTTLLKKINNELGKRSDFNIIMWVVVSKSPNLYSIMDNIRKWAGIGDKLWNHCGNQDEKAAKIYEVLKEKKFVLLLDDIWERLDLEKLGVPHPKETNFKSKVLFTTRNEDVCEKMKAQRKFKVQILTEQDALELFYMKVGEETLTSNPSIPKIAEEMAKECKGLPLALTVVGSAMAGVRSVEAWEHSRNNLTSSSWIALDWETKVLFVLKFSYDRLPDEAHKNCFLYCALYPEDYVIPVYDVIDKWIGEGFLYSDRMRSVQDIRIHGGSIIEKLKLSCLLESVEDDIILDRSIKMHDVIREMALWIARDEDRNKNKVIVHEDASLMSQANVESWEMVERISIMNGVKLCLQRAACTNLKTLLKLHTDSEIYTLENIQYARRLKVLELCNEVPEGVGGLSSLEYLSLLVGNLHASNISKLENLKNLKIFHLNVSKPDGVPLGVISKLQQLKVFRFCTGGILGEFRDERAEEGFLLELESLPNLEELWIDIKTESGLNKLFKSAKLQSCLYSLVISDVRAPINMPLLLTTMSKMKHLQRLIFNGLIDEMDFSVCDTCCLSMLRTLEISHCPRIHHLTWLRYAPLLQKLAVQQCSSMKQVIKEDGKDVDSIFSSLVALELTRLPALISIHERALSFPSLRSIQVQDCQNLKKLSFDSHSAKTKLRLISGPQLWWDNLEWDHPTTKAIFHSRFQEHSYLQIQLSLQDSSDGSILDWYGSDGSILDGESD